MTRYIWTRQISDIRDNYAKAVRRRCWANGNKSKQRFRTFRRYSDRYLSLWYSIALWWFACFQRANVLQWAELYVVVCRVFVRTHAAFAGIGIDLRACIHIPEIILQTEVIRRPRCQWWRRSWWWGCWLWWWWRWWRCWCRWRPPGRRWWQPRLR